MNNYENKEYNTKEYNTEEVTSEDLQNLDTYCNEETNNVIEHKEKMGQKRKPVRFLLEVCVYIFIIYACLILVPTYVMQRTIVDGPSMENALYHEEQLIVEKVSYHFAGLNRFDIVVFYPYGREVGEYYVKRVIGLPGETLQIIGSDIYINGEILEEEYGKDPITFAGWAEEPIQIGEDEYFVLGDNRSISFDSRMEEVGLVNYENIGGKVIFRIWPLNQFGFVD